MSSIRNMGASKVFDLRPNPAAGFIRPNGSFVGLRRQSHAEDARRMGWSLSDLLKQGWIRKVGQGSYEGSFTDTTLAAVEVDLIRDHKGLSGTSALGKPVDFIVLDDFATEASVAISLKTFEQAGFRLRRAIARSRKLEMRRIPIQVAPAKQ